MQEHQELWLAQSECSVRGCLRAISSGLAVSFGVRIMLEMSNKGIGHFRTGWTNSGVIHI